MAGCAFGCSLKTMLQRGETEDPYAFLDHASALSAGSRHSLEGDSKDDLLEEAGMEAPRTAPVDHISQDGRAKAAAAPPRTAPPLNLSRLHLAPEAEDEAALLGKDGLPAQRHGSDSGTAIGVAAGSAVNIVRKKAAARPM